MLPHFDVFPKDRFLLGEGLFETIRIENNIPCYAPLHWQRLNQAALKLQIPIPLGYEDWLQEIVKIIKTDSSPRTKIKGMKIFLLAGEAERGLTQTAQKSYLIYQLFKPIINKNFVQLTIADWSRHSLNPIYQIKSISYLEQIFALKMKNSNQDIIFYNEQGHLTETSIANFYIVKHDVLLTPPQSDGLIPGIIRNRLLELVSNIGLKAKEVSITPNQLYNADLVFTSNVLQGIKKVTHFNKKMLKSNDKLFNDIEKLLGEDEKRIDISLS